MHRLVLLLAFCCFVTMGYASASLAALQADINQDNAISLEDAILGLQVVAGETPTIPEFVNDLDVDGDNRIGLAEVVHALQALGISPPGTVVSNGQVWMDRNLGASRVATSIDDEQAYGDLYQWGRGTDGHEKRTSTTTSTLSTEDDPQHGAFITPPSDPYDWRSPENVNLWQPDSSINSPCPTGFRLPTETEFLAEMASWTSQDESGAFNSPLKLVPAGHRLFFGSVWEAGAKGRYWTSTIDTNFAGSSRNLSINTSSAEIGGSSRSYGLSVRCIQDD